MSYPTQDNNESKAEFRKLTNEATNRKYRRQSPVSGISDDGESFPLLVFCLLMYLSLEDMIEIQYTLYTMPFLVKLEHNSY